ncbi:hypothetical protein GCM10010464_05100 [Pseudonocardia yunnanensis]
MRAGVVTKAELRGRRYVRVFPDVYAAASAHPLDPLLRARAAFLLAGGRSGVRILGGRTARCLVQPARCTGGADGARKWRALAPRLAAAS